MMESHTGLMGGGDRSQPIRLKGATDVIGNHRIKIISTQKGVTAR